LPIPPGFSLLVALIVLKGLMTERPLSTFSMSHNII
jgi:hypothetical protein